jgi:hypothetical protein
MAGTERRLTKNEKKRIKKKEELISTKTNTITDSNKLIDNKIIEKQVNLDIKIEYVSSNNDIKGMLNNIYNIII